jgi:hypothetical protein
MTALLVVAALAAVSAPASAQTFTLTATLTGANETPSPGLNTGAFGSATIVVDMGARTVGYNVSVYNLPSGIVASHIHVGAAGTAGPVVVNFSVPATASNDFSYSGTVKDTDFIVNTNTSNLGIRSADDMLQAILGGNAYVNVHSQANPAGEIRGQLSLKP